MEMNKKTDEKKAESVQNERETSVRQWGKKGGKDKKIKKMCRKFLLCRKKCYICSPKREVNRLSAELGM